MTGTYTTSRHAAVPVACPVEPSQSSLDTREGSDLEQGFVTDRGVDMNVFTEVDILANKNE